MKTLGASIAVRNGVEFDFCFEECIRSVLPVCDEVLVSDSDSTDQTRERLNALARDHSKIRLINYPHTNPNGDGMWVMTWTNWIRERLTTDYNFQIDADEVLHESAYDKIRERIQGKEVTLRLRRWNFWQDAQHVLPFGRVCAQEVLRISPKRHWLPADIPLAQGQDAMNLDTEALDIELHHYGFLRRPEAFFKKERFLQTAFTGGFDPKLEALSKKPDVKWMEEHPEYYPLQDFTGTHPTIAHRWLRNRGYTP